MTIGSCESRRLLPSSDERIVSSRLTRSTSPARSHLHWTVPPAVVLWVFFRKLRTPRDVYKTCFLIAVRVLLANPASPGHSTR